MGISIAELFGGGKKNKRASVLLTRTDLSAFLL